MSDFDQYLTRHYAHIGDQARHRVGKKRQLRLTYQHVLPAERDAAMLEIGPGYGQLLELLRTDLGYGNTIAIDLSQEVVDFCNRILPGSTEREDDTVAYLRRHPGRFERVFAFHVLEHVPKSAAPPLLDAIRESLRPGGTVVIELPNMANLFTAGYLRWADRTHECGYSEMSLRHLLESSGFTDVSCFAERLPLDHPKRLFAIPFRGFASLVQRLIYKGYELPVPRVLTPALCATARRPR